MFKNGDLKLVVNSMSSIIDRNSETSDKYANIIFSYNSPEYCESSNIEYSYDIW